MKYILGKKIGMTQIWKGEERIGVTVVEAGPCTVVQVKTKDKDGYQAIQMGFGMRKDKNIAKPQKGHMKGLDSHRYLREFRVDEKDGASMAAKRGDKVNADTFVAGDIVKIAGISKGKGFQGVVKRHGFHGQDATHGHKDQERMSGSISAGGVQHVFKGVRMGGRTGGDRVTTTNLEIVEVDGEKNLLYVRGSVPGAKNGLLLVQGEGELKIAEDKPVVEEKTEETITTEETAPVEPVETATPAEESSEKTEA